MLPVDAFLVRTQHGARRAQHAGVLAHIAGPRMAAQARQQIGREMNVTIRVDTGQHALGQQLKIGALAQGRQLHGEAIDAVIKIAAKTPLVGLFAQLSVGGTDQCEINIDQLRATERGDLTLLQHAQQAGLHVQRHVTNFIEKQRAAMRFTQATGAAFASRAGEGPRCVAEQLGFDQAFGHGRAVNGHKGTVAPRAAVVRGAREKFLADTRFALQQQRDRLVHDAPGLVGGAAPARVAGIQPGQGIRGCGAK